MNRQDITSRLDLILDHVELEMKEAGNKKDRRAAVIATIELLGSVAVDLNRIAVALEASNIAEEIARA